ncbi:hypothetical protein D3C87_1989460 [compost metagenome]
MLRGGYDDQGDISLLRAPVRRIPADFHGAKAGISATVAPKTHGRIRSRFADPYACAKCALLVPYVRNLRVARRDDQCGQ